MDAQALHNALGQFDANVIERLIIDIPTHKISLDIQTKRTSKDISYHNMVFDGVSAYYFVESPLDQDRFDSSTWKYIELTWIGYLENATVKIDYEVSPDPGYPKYGSSANFMIEMWSSALFIEAKSIVIDGERFEVGYPVM